MSSSVGSSTSSSSKSSTSSPSSTSRSNSTSESSKSTSQGPASSSTATGSGNVSTGGANVGNSEASPTSTGPSTTDATTISSEAKATGANEETSASVDAISRGLAGDTPEATTAETAKPETKSPSALGETLGSKTLRGGMKSESVGALQGALNDRLGLSLETDGKFGAKTTDAVKSFQRQQGLKADGIVGKDTREALMAGGRTADPSAARPTPGVEGANPAAAQGAATPAGAATPTGEATPAGATAAGEASPAGAATPTEGAAAATDAAKPRDAAQYAALSESLGSKDLARGAKDPKAVTALQGALNEALGKDMAVDGKFGKDTVSAVKEFQEKQGLDPSGTLDAKTREALMGPRPARTREQLQDAEAARQQAATESKPDMIFGDRISAADQEKVRAVAAELQTQPNELMAVFGVETGGTFDPAQRAHGTKNGAVGLIQFTQTAVDAMNQRRESAGQEPISKKDLAGMNFTDQMDHVRDYLRDTMAERGVTGPVTREELYTAVFAPSAINRADSANIYSSGSTAYRSNRSLDTDRNGHITREEITSRVNQWYDQGVEGLS